VQRPGACHRVDSKTPAATSNPQSLSCGAPDTSHTLHCNLHHGYFVQISTSSTRIRPRFRSIANVPLTACSRHLLGHRRRQQDPTSPPLAAPALFDYFEPDLPLSYANELVSIFELASDNPGQPTPISLERLEHAVAELCVSSST
jgi:hypothetical protein